MKDKNQEFEERKKQLEDMKNKQQQQLKNDNIKKIYEPQEDKRKMKYNPKPIDPPSIEEVK